MKTKLVWLMFVLVVIWGLKRHYSNARADDLRWILAPTARLVGVATGVPFAPEPGAGYLSRERLFLIEKSCAGVNFMIAAFAMLAFVQRRRVVSGVSGAAVLGLSLLAGYAAAVVVNAARITVALWLAARPITLAGLTSARIHRLEGIAVYFGSLVLLYELALRIERGTAVQTFRRTAVPIAFYYAIALAIPLANGARLGSGFTEHAVMVLIFPPISILVVNVLLILPRVARRRVVAAGSRAKQRIAIMVSSVIA